jgi:hypothetical protein
VQVMRAGISLEQLEVENKNYHLTIATNYIGAKVMSTFIKRFAACLHVYYIYMSMKCRGK